MLLKKSNFLTPTRIIKKLQLQFFTKIYPQIYIRYSMNKHVTVLMGGWNSEREVSLMSGEAVYQSLLRLGYLATKIDFNRNIVEQLKQDKTDIVFNALHGKYGEDGKIQGLLDVLNIPYTHSGLLPSAIAINKLLTSKICALDGISSPKSALIYQGEDQNNHKIIFEEIGQPFVIKPINEGSSVGVKVVLQSTDFDIKDIDWSFGKAMIVQKYIAGQEIHVAIMDNQPLGAIELKSSKLFYDYESKYTQGITKYIMPAQISANKYQEVLNLALQCHKTIGCSGISRVDFILNNQNDGDDQFYLLEVNTHPGFTATSLVPKIAQYKGISFDDIVQYLVLTAKCGM